LALVILLVLVSAALLSPGLLVGPSLDASIFSHIGERLLSGTTPYLGVWDHKPPGIYLISAGAHWVLGWAGPWAADWLISLGATVGLGLVVARQLTNLGVAGWPRGLSAVGPSIFAANYLLALGGGLTEAPAAFLAALALTMAARPASVFRQLATGGLIGSAIIISLQLLPAALVVVAVAILLRPAGERLRSAGLLVLAAALPLALVTVWLAAAGALPAAIDEVLGYSAAYRGSSGGYGAILAAPVAAWTVLTSLFLVAPAIFGAVSILRASQQHRAVGVALLVWIGVSLVSFGLQGRFYAHYAIPLAFPLGVLTGLGVQRVARSISRAVNATTRVVIALPMILAIITSTLASVVAGGMELDGISKNSTRLQAVASRIQDLPGSSLLVWGNEPRLYDLAGRIPATRYSYLYPLTTPGYSTASMVDEVVRQLTSAPPLLVVDAGSDAPGQPGFLPLLVQRRITTDGRDLDLLNPVRVFVSEHYTLMGIVAGWPIYVLGEGH